MNSVKQLSAVQREASSCLVRLSGSSRRAGITLLCASALRNSPAFMTRSCCSTSLTIRFTSEALRGAQLASSVLKVAMTCFACSLSLVAADRRWAARLLWATASFSAALASVTVLRHLERASLSSPTFWPCAATSLSALEIAAASLSAVAASSAMALAAEAALAAAWLAPARTATRASASMLTTRASKGCHFRGTSKVCESSFLTMQASMRRALRGTSGGPHSSFSSTAAKR
mmetsp:Transcript_81068/g.250192  ORF Transcript_81068/g.250192 Transcript_81068/m.250192 type:complete len:232 (+) Transcript_81068:277-972(+)